MRRNHQFFYNTDDAASGTGDGTDETTDTPAKTDAPDLRAVVDGIKAAIAESRQAAVPVAPIVPAPVDYDARRQALITEGEAINARVNELAAAGDMAGALAIRDEFNAKVNRSLAAPAGDSTMVKTAVQVGERLARTEHKDIMSRWGDEVRRSVEALPLDERVQPDAWDRAVAKVRTNHFDELMSEAVNGKVEEMKRTFVPPPSAPGSRGNRALTGAAAKLDEVQLYASDLCGVTPEEYAAQVKREETYDALPFKQRGPFPGYPVLDGPVTKGSF